MTEFKEKYHVKCKKSGNWDCDKICTKFTIIVIDRNRHCSNLYVDWVTWMLYNSCLEEIE